MRFNVPWGKYGIHGTIFPNSIDWNLRFPLVIILDMYFDFKQNQLKIDLTTENINNIDLLNNYITLIVETFSKNLSEYEYNSKAIEIIGNHLLYELDSLNKIKKSDRT